MFNKRLDKKIFYLFLSIMGIVLGLCFVFFFSIKHKQTIKSNYIMNDWYYVDGEKVDFRNFNGDTIVSKLEQYEEGHDLIINVKNTDMRIYIGNEKVYETDNKEPYIFGRTKGSYFVNLSIDKKDIGKEIKIEFNEVYKNYYGRINNIYYGKGSEVVTSLVGKNFLSSCLCFMILFLGLIVVVVFPSIFNKRIVGAEFLYLGVFSISIGTYLIAEENVLQLLFGHEAFFHFVSEVSMMFIVVPFMLFIDRIYNPKNKKILYLICIYSILVSLFNLSMDVFKTFDLRQTLLLVHISIILAVLYCLYLIIKDFKNSKERNTIHYLSIGSICLGAIMDIVNIYYSFVVENSVFIKLGVIVFLVLEISDIFIDKLDKYKSEFETELLSTLAYHDGLTKLYNRTSFLEDIEELNQYKEKIVIVMFDVNNLKTINDNYGHTSGDELIIESSKAINNYIGVYGKAYRIGGDEFVVILEDSNIDVDKEVNNMNVYIKNINKKLAFDISIAYGYAIYDSKIDKTLNDTFDRADALMYKNKKKMKGIK